MTDIIIIGGGVAGLAAGAALSADMHVTLLERESALGYHTSGRSAALIEENYGAPSVQALNKASFAYLSAAHGGYLTPRGLMIAADAPQKAQFDRDVATMGLGQIALADALDMVPILEPSKLHFAAHHAEAYDIDTDRMLQDFARVIRQSGGTIETGASVTAIDHVAGQWRVSTDTRTYEAPRLLNAAGAWADGIAEMAGIAPLGVKPYRRSMARLAAPGGHDVTRWPMFFGVGESFYAKPDAGALLVSPADEDASHPHDAYADDMVLAEGLARYQQMVAEPVTRPLATWAGLRSFAPDRSLVLGPDPVEPSFIWSAGQGGYGFQTGPAAGQLVADLTLGRAPALPADVVAQLTPARLR